MGCATEIALGVLGIETQAAFIKLPTVPKDSRLGTNTGSIATWKQPGCT